MISWWLFLPDAKKGSSIKMSSDIFLRPVNRGIISDSNRFCV